MPSEMFWEAVAIGVDVAVAYLFYKAYRDKEDEASIIANAVSYSVGDDMKEALEVSPAKCIPYACVEGVTEATGGVTAPLKSHFTDEVGVVRHEVFIEHKSRRIQGFWSDVRRVIKDVANVRPFCIVDPDSRSVRRLKVEVMDPLSADYFLDHLPVTYDRFDETQDGFLSRSLDRLFGERTKGYQETERMLGLGVPIVGLGMLGLDGRRIVLKPPEGGQRYIVTTLSRPEIVRSIRSEVRSYRICFWVFATIGAGIIGYVLFRFVRRHMALRRSQQRIEELRAAARGTGVAGENGNQCAVCLSNVLEVVILNCGHVCLCSECALSLPEPRFCPICRSVIDRFVPIYIS